MATAIFDILKKIVGFFLAATGLLLAVGGLANAFDEGKWGDIIIVLVLCPPLLWGGWVLATGWRKVDPKVRERQLDAIFLKLIEEEKGRVSLPRFALEASLTVDEAKSYLDTKARTLNGNFEVGDSGQVVYLFSL